MRLITKAKELVANALFCENIVLENSEYRLCHKSYHTGANSLGLVSQFKLNTKID
jgi:hypothetical protein